MTIPATPSAPDQGEKASPLPADHIPFEHRVFTKKELAAYFGVAERTIEHWMRRRYLPYLKLGGTIRFKMDDVLRHLEANHRVKPRQDLPPHRRAAHCSPPQVV
jgi:excisionase family DNA binding protein